MEAVGTKLSTRIFVGESELTKSYRDLFEFDPEIIYFNHAATGMLPKRSAAAMNDHVNYLKKNGTPPIDDLMAVQSQFREEAARLLNVDPKHVAFIKNTTEGLSIALHSIKWNPGDNMIVQEDAFPASLYPAHYCFPDVEKRYLPLAQGTDRYRRLRNYVDDRTRAIVVDYVHFLSGTRQELAELWEIRKQSNALLIVDGIQALGAIQVDLQNTPVDFFAAGGMKWLQGPMGTGVLYVNTALLDDLVPFHVGWLSGEYDDMSSFYPIRPLKKDASRFQPANENFVGMVGLTESIKIQNKITSSAIENRIGELTDYFIQKLTEHQFDILTPGDKSERAGIVTFKHERLDSGEIFELLSQRKIKCSPREGWVRVAIHFYNTEQELEEIFNVVLPALD